MITKKEIKDKLDEYDQNRSCFKLGFFLYAIDYFHPDTKFYYDLRNFYNQDLSQLSSKSELSSKNIEMLAKLINRYQIGPNSTNSAIVDLYEAMEGLIKRENGTRAASLSLFG
jgi:hypothetical protein